MKKKKLSLAGAEALLSKNQMRQISAGSGIDCRGIKQECRASEDPSDWCCRDYGNPQNYDLICVDGICEIPT